MGTVFQHDKRSGITYAYNSLAYWDPQKKQARAKRTLIGRLDVKTGEIVPTDGRMRKSCQGEGAASNFQAPPSFETSRRYYGGTYLLDAIGERLGLTDDLKRCFPETYKQILSIAYYLVLENDAPLYRFEKWGALHKHPYNRDIPSQRSSELFASISEPAKEAFFRSQGQRRCEKEYWVYDITSISSYSEHLRQVQYGYNRESDPLPQLNLALVFGEESNLPFYYRKLAGKPEHEKQYTQWFDVKNNRGRVKALVKQDVVDAAKRYYGFFALISNETMDAVTALETYRNKDVAEKAFGNLKERLNLRRALVSSEQSLEGKLFVTFVALIYLSHIKKRMEVSSLFKDYTLQGLLDKLDIIECYESPGKKLRVGEMLEKQKELYTLLGYPAPASL